MNERNSKTKRLIAIGCLSLPVIFFFIFFLPAFYFDVGNKSRVEQPSESIVEDSDSVKWNGKQDLPRQSSNTGSIAIPGIEELVFTANQKTQQVNFYNPPQNNCYFQMSLYINEKKQWESGYIAPDNGYYQIKLNEGLKPMETEAYLLVRCFRSNKTELNSAKVKFRLIVK